MTQRLSGILSVVFLVLPACSKAPEPKVNPPAPVPPSAAKPMEGGSSKPTVATPAKPADPRGQLPPAPSNETITAFKKIGGEYTLHKIGHFGEIAHSIWNDPPGHTLIPGFDFKELPTGPLPPVEVPFGLYFASAQGELTSFDSFGKMQNLYAINIHHVRASEDALKSLSKFDDLRAIAIGSSEAGATDAVLRELKQLKNLISLDLYLTTMTPAGMAEVGEMAKLEKLKISMKHHVQLSESAFKHLKGCKNLKELSLGGRFGNIDLALNDITELKTLTRLLLATEALTGEGVKKLKELNNLEEITIYLSDSSKETRIKELQGLLKLRKLSIWGAKVSNADVGDIAQFNQLTDLSIGHKQITDVGIAKLHGMTNLTKLRLMETKISRKGISELKAALPKCDISFQ